MFKNIIKNRIKDYVDLELKEEVKKSKWVLFKEKLYLLRIYLAEHKAIDIFFKVIIVCFILFVVAEVVFQYNRLNAWMVVVDVKKANIDQEIQRRNNLIPNLAYIVQRYALYERKIFKYVSEARQAVRLAKESTNMMQDSSKEMKGILGRLMAIVENYPNLKATNSLQDLIQGLIDTEDRILNAKNEYNYAAEQFNQYRSIFPGNLFGFIYGLDLVPFINIDGEAMKVPKMNFKLK